MYQFVVPQYFRKQIKKYAKKHRSFLGDVIFCLKNFDPKNHTHLGEDVYKIRLMVSDMKKGKKNSFRLIIVLVHQKGTLIPLTLYYKGDQDSISKREIQEHFKFAMRELLF